MASAIATITQVYVRPTLEEQYQRSFFRRAWDRVESILALVQNKARFYRDENDDDDIDEAEFQNPYNPHRRNNQKEGSIRTRFSYETRFSTDSDSSRSSSTARRYEPWQQQIDEELAQIKVTQKDLISRWVKGEVSPWFD